MKRETGAAIVIVLAFVVLLTTIVLAFFSRATDQRQIANSSLGQTRAEILAKGALETVIGDLLQEIAAGSNITLQNNIAVYEPKAGAINVSLVGIPGNTASLVKRSYGGSAFYYETRYDSTSYPPSNRASTVPSTVSSLNGRVVTPARWNKARLLPSTVADGTPSVSESYLPDWIFVSRDGSNPTSWDDRLRKTADAHCVTGRYAYAIYNVGGLLDINSAGYPSGTDPTEAAQKGVLPLADLTQLPGVNQQMVDAIVATRNYTAAQPVGTFPSFSGFNTTDYLTWIRDPRSTFLQATNRIRNNRTDRPFLSRQDFLNFSRSIGLPAGALQFLTTFTRGLNAPSWGPTRNAVDLGGGSNTAYAYSDNRNTAGSANRLTANVRATQPATITSYHSDGSSYTYSVKAGDPLLQRRFPLGRLKWLGRNGPQNGGDNSVNGNIMKCFGLRWLSATALPGIPAAGNVWRYVGSTGTGTTTQTTIKTLDQVASENREPNFFELLQAGILSGSLGLTSLNGGVAQRTLIAADSSMIVAANQIMQVGANIIDQQDDDSYPSRVFFNGKEFAGSENIPMINKMLWTAYRPQSNQRIIHGWYEFEVWNPYTGPVNDAPTRFRIRQVSTTSPLAEAMMVYDLNKAFTNTTPPPPPDPDKQQLRSYPHALSGRSLVVDQGHLSANLSVSAQDPKMLDTLRQEGATVSGDVPLDTYNDVNASYSGIYVGSVNLDEDPAPATDPIPKKRLADGQLHQPYNVKPFIQQSGNGGMIYLLEYDYGGNFWVAVQKFNNWTDWTELAANGVEALATANAQTFTTPDARLLGMTGPDPRTLRFGMGGAGRTASVSPSSYPVPNTTAFWNKTMFWSLTDKRFQYAQTAAAWGANFTPNISPAPSNLTSRSNYRFADNSGSGATVITTGTPTRTICTDPYYVDIDGVRRFGDAVWDMNDTSRGVFPTLPIAERPQDRPVILNRAFRSVGELNYAFRDLPFKSLDFCSENSADAGLLDLFCISEGDEQTGISAGLVDLNTNSPEVIKAILAGVSRTPDNPGSNLLSSVEITNLSAALVSLTANMPLLNKSELATRLSPDAVRSRAMDDVIKPRKTAVIGTLAAVGQTRTWNLMIDVIAQAGKYPPNASDLSQFVVEGERRYWLHIAIDRYTGKVVGRQLELVTN